MLLHLKAAALVVCLSAWPAVAEEPALRPQT